METNLDKAYTGDKEDLGNPNSLNEQAFYDNWIKNNLNNVMSNEKLMDIIVKITNYSSLLKNDEVRYLVLVSLISSDNIVDVSSAQTALDQLMFFHKYIDLFDISEEVKKETIKYVNKGIKIVKRDLKEFTKNGES